MGTWTHRTANTFKNELTIYGNDFHDIQLGRQKVNDEIKDVHGQNADSTEQAHRLRGLPSGTRCRDGELRPQGGRRTHRRCTAREEGEEGSETQHGRRDGKGREISSNSQAGFLFQIKDQKGKNLLPP